MRNTMRYIGMFLLPVFWAGSLSAQHLQDYLLIAAENNSDVRAAYAEFEAALEKVPQVRSLPDPNLTVSAFGKMVETRLGPQQARFSLMQMFPWFGTLKAKEQAAALQAEAGFRDFLAERNRVLFEVSRQYYELYLLEQQLEFQKKNLEILKDYKELALAKVRSGTGNLPDVLQVDILRNETQTAMEVLQLKRRPLHTRFNALLNREKQAPVVIPDSIEVPGNAAEPSFADIQGNPELEKLNRLLASSHQEEIIARKEGYPDLGVGLDYIVVGDRTDMLVEGSGTDAFMPMLSIRLPIFRSKYRAAQKEAARMTESLSHRVDALQDQLETELERAIFEYHEAQAMLSLYQRQVESTNQILSLLLSSYRNATSDFEELLRVRQELLSFQLKKAQAEYAGLTAAAKIRYVSGKIDDYEK